MNSLNSTRSSLITTNNKSEDLVTGRGATGGQAMRSKEELLRWKYLHMMKKDKILRLLVLPESSKSSCLTKTKFLCSLGSPFGGVRADWSLGRAREQSTGPWHEATDSSFR
jgi:hypothetical protein